MINNNFFKDGFTFTKGNDKYTVLRKISDDEQLYKVQVESDLLETSITKYLTYTEIVYIIYGTDKQQGGLK